MDPERRRGTSSHSEPIPMGSNSSHTDATQPDSAQAPATARVRAKFNLFVYGSLRSDGAANHMLEGCERMADATVGGGLYDIDGRYPALLLYGDGLVHGEVWRCPASLLAKLDRYEGVGKGMFRRVGIEIDGYPCWTYAVGPGLGRKINSENRIESGRWTAPTQS
jgi:gamma-glutamylcyclotransferase (GGCT)/AIG2-like uncharacterized protein YtfP